VPSCSTFGDWLVRLGRGGGIEGMAGVNEEVVGEILAKDEREAYSLDVDTTVIEAEKREARWTYKKVKGYQPILGFLKENLLCLAYEFRQGNEPSGSRAEEFLERREQALLEGKKITHLRSESAFYQAEVLNWCEEKGKKYTITADKDKEVWEAVKTVRDWKRLLTPEGEETGREVGSAIHIMNKTLVAFRLIVQRWPNPQMDLFRPEQWCYQVISTNMDELEPEEVVWFHNRRGQVEDLIKELNFGLEQMVSGDFLANALYFAIGVLAYNTTQAQKLLFMEEEWRQTTIATLRWPLVEVAGKIIRHGRKVILRIVAPPDKLRIFLLIRQRCFAFR